MFRCIHCNIDITNSKGKKHENSCPYNPINIRKIVLYLKEYALTNSKLNKNFKPFPTVDEFDKFCEMSKIMRVITIRRNYLIGEGLALEDWLIEIVEYALSNNIVTPIEFPYFLQFLYDNWLFLPKEEYKKRYEAAISFEDGEYYIDDNEYRNLSRKIRGLT
jgi:hypothetical protein